MSQAGELLLAPVRDKLARCGTGCAASQARVVIASSGDGVGLRGGYAYWTDCLRERGM